MVKGVKVFGVEGFGGEKEKLLRAEGRRGFIRARGSKRDHN